ncbi:MAG: hypothetical protein A2Z62_00560 [Candidatus Terrybacteria bacterium RIFCSPLOWO2_02_42_20]|uniref:Type 4 fimbrial biogenesis protein PilX N-terminal domain-containing protein n=1 Tax=Candidatus Terrybacteria bacterium RIFCSPLOWO2_02_42_20 TaxID=1802370 RepID=A0A1G2Q3A5_9BACT|nr:MAG: hypothetical protein A2Z62_00560 [Candidatus Terrybacteria bacterium RIFCSPLOWO2_02_42_20]
MKNHKLKHGFALLLSIFVINVVLLVSLGVSGVVINEFKLSGVGRESQIAFYAADAGIECFFYWEIKHPGLADSAFGYYDAPSTIKCAGNNFTIPAKSNSPYGPYKINLSDNSCAKITVTKSSFTTVESRGYNTKDCDSTSSFKVERAIRVTSK